MTLQTIKQAIDALTPQERRELRAYLDAQLTEPAPHDLPIEERIRQLDAAAAKIRADLTDREWTEAERAMNAEYIEPWDESEWTG